MHAPNSDQNDTAARRTPGGDASAVRSDKVVTT